MRQEPLTLENLKNLDFGKISAAFDRELARVVEDCQDRPGDKKARTVQIKFALVPKIDLTGDGHNIDLESIRVECEISSAVPKRRTKVYEMLPKQNGKIVFHPDLPDDPEGSTLYDPDVKEANKKK